MRLRKTKIGSYSRQKHPHNIWILIMTVLTLSACGPPYPSLKPELKKVTYADLPGWGEDALEEAHASLKQSCQAMCDSPLEMSFTEDIKIAAWQPFCTALKDIKNPTRHEMQALFEHYLTPYQVWSDSGSQGLFTGYYEPQLRGSQRKTAAYKVPIYACPPDLIMIEDLGIFRDGLKGTRIAGRNEKGHLKPYYTRAEIESGALEGQGLELVWVDDQVDAYFMAIQGSGSVVFEDGSEVHLGYAGTNGYPYTSIGKVLVEKGEFTPEAVSMQSIRAWLSEHPEKTQALFHKNQSFVFFRNRPEGGPVGAQGLPLTAQRSLAVDRIYIPLGAPLWLDIEHPDLTQPQVRQLVIAQDTGGAIKGPIRGDYFWGAGAQAGELAGIMKSKGGYYIFLPRLRD